MAKVKSQKSKVKILLFFFFSSLFLLSTIYYLLSTARWDGKSRFTVVDLADPLTIASWDPQTNRGIKVRLPNNLEIETVAGRGKLLAKSLKPAGSADWAAASIANFLGVWVVGEKSSLGVWDRLRWWRGARRVAWQEIDLNQTGWLELTQTADGERVARLAPTWDEWAGEQFVSLAVAQERLALKVVNTTAVTGLAARASRQIETSGIRVIEIASADGELDRCRLAGLPAQRRTVGVELLLVNFGCSWQEGPELTLYLGRKYHQFLDGD